MEKGDNMLEKYLATLGGDTSLIGYEYLLDCLEILSKHKEFKTSLHRLLYPKVAEKHNTTKYAIFTGIERYIKTTSKNNISVGKFIKELEIKFRKK